MMRKWLSTLIITALCVGLLWGRWLGHAEMKRWQDDYYRQTIKKGEIIEPGEYCFVTKDTSIQVTCPHLVGFAPPPFEIPSGWSYKNVRIDPRTKTIKGDCPVLKPSKLVYKLPNSCAFKDSHINCWPPTVLTFKDKNNTSIVCTDGRFENGKCIPDEP